MLRLILYFGVLFAAYAVLTLMAFVTALEFDYELLLLPASLLAFAMTAGPKMLKRWNDATPAVLLHNPPRASPETPVLCLLFAALLALAYDRDALPVATHSSVMAVIEEFVFRLFPAIVIFNIPRRMYTKRFVAAVVSVGVFVGGHQGSYWQLGVEKVIFAAVAMALIFITRNVWLGVGLHLSTNVLAVSWLAYSPRPAIDVTLFLAISASGALAVLSCYKKGDQSVQMLSRGT
ncbi:CPBP family glutamic-type intramembrane protease [Clavibacter michiganensis]|uniref:CPBP family glutamic-type intramembrane protease n=1 Tax=Clavibacter michiganensis TaxID=28447 RepID=UPI000A3783B9|nr:CPBP family glutamic-type intramembrane protease [Clavibacter michiganensis]